MTPAATIRRDLRSPPGIADPAELRRWRTGYIAGLILDGRATDPEVYRVIRDLPDVAALIGDAKAWLAGAGR